MANGPVVFVLGAGLSAPYGFPMGNAYRRMLLQMAAWQKGDPLELFDPATDVDAIARNEAARTILCRLLGNKCDTQQRHVLGRAFRASGAASIDRFVSIAKTDGREGVRVLARKLVVILLSCCEPNRPMNSGAYRMLLDLWGLDRPGKTDLLRGSFVTFNYDRGFERAMFERDGRVYYSGLARVYGHMGRLYDPSPDARNGSGHLEWASWLEHNMDHAQLNRCASHVEFIDTPSERPRESSLAYVRDCIASANTLVFLGFGFDPYNCRYLGLPYHDPEPAWPRFTDEEESALPEKVDLHEKTLYATTYGMNASESNFIVDALLGPNRDRNWERQRARFEPVTCEQLLDKHRAHLEEAIR